MNNRLGIASVMRVGDEPKHEEFHRQLAKKLCDLITSEFDKLRESGGWHPVEAAGCACKATTAIIGSLVNMIAGQSRPGSDGPVYLSPAAYNSLYDDLHAVIQKHIHLANSHLHSSN